MVYPRLNRAPPMRCAALCVAVASLVAVTMTWPRSGRAAHIADAAAADCRPATRTQVKWLIHTGNLAGRWPPPRPAADGHGAITANRSARWCGSAAPNAISRLQMVDGGTVAVLVMPAGDGARRCCDRGSAPQFSLGSVRLRHGTNNLYPVVQPFPDWRAYVDAAGTSPPPKPAKDDSTDSAECETGPTSPPPDGPGGNGQQRIVNAVDAFLDDLGRILWVLDTGDADEDTCDGDTQDLSPPKFLAIDVHTHQTISAVSLSRVWRPGVTCFQYIVAVYPDVIGDENDDDDDDDSNNKTNAAWPLVVISDSGTDRLLVYSHCVDRFTEIALPPQEDDNAAGDDEDLDVDEDDGAAANRSAGAQTSRCRPRAWPVPPSRDILYTVPLYPRPGHTALLVTYRGRPHVYTLRLQPSETAAPESPAADASRVPPVPVTATVSTLGRKPCVMVMLGSDRRRTDRGDGFAGGGTTVYFRMADANDVWSWDTEKCGTSVGLIDPRHFRLVRRGRTCRFPVAVSAAPVTGGGGGDGDGSEPDNDDGKGNGDSAGAPPGVRQVVWVLETNAADHFAGTADRMGANAKLQPIEVDSGGADNSTVMQLKPSLRMRPSDGRRRNVTAPRPNRCFPGY